MKIIDKLTQFLREAALFNSEVQVAPACILWPDRERQWEAVVPRLQAEMPEFFVLGDYNTEKRTGPAIWLRCVIAGHVEDITLPEGQVPILYLPGVSRQDLRAIESCPDHLKPLAELQYRGVIWSQVNAKDWTILAFLKSDQGGLGLDVAQDNDTKQAMHLAIYHLLDEEMDLLKGKRLGKDYFNTLLTGGDPVRDLLLWLDQGDAFQNNRGENEWKAFVEVCKSQLSFNPQAEGVLAGAAKLATHESPWHAVWERYCEAPTRYPNIPGLISKCHPPVFDLFTDIETAGGWPQWNETQEANLQRDLMALCTVPAHEARKRLLDLDKRHGRRRQLVWAELGEAPLSQALEHLTVLAKTTQNVPLAAGGVDDLEAGYRTEGWLADDAVMRALAFIDKPQDCDAVTTAIRAVYLPWVEESARHLQKLVDGATYPGGIVTTANRVMYHKNECILFVDGLRFDLAKRLIALLKRSECDVEEKTAWAALPSVTATGKPAVTPVKHKIRGEDANADFEPCVAETGQSLKGGYHLKKLLEEDGWQVLGKIENGDGQGKAWCEFGNIDHEGHGRGWKLAKHIAVFLNEIRDRIIALLHAGWECVRVVTDHGWLLLPGGLPTVTLSSALTDNKWGRCAAIKPGAFTDERLYTWFWNPNQQFALADGVSCFRKREYTHGGLSLQECLTLELEITLGSRGGPKTSLSFTNIVWKGLRCTVVVDGQGADLSLDLRTQPGDPSSSVVASVKPLRDDGTVSVVVEDEDLAGRQATLVLMDTNGNLIGQQITEIGGGAA